jgi:hypothetical protein
MPVLFNISKTIKQNEKMVVTKGIPSLVRLQPLYRCLNGQAHTGDLLLDPSRLKVSGMLADWEGGLASGLSAADQHQLPSEMIEASSHVVQHVSQTERDRHGRRFRLPFNAPDMLKSFSVEIVNNYARLRLVEGKQIIAKKIEMLVRPYILGLKTKVQGHEGVSPMKKEAKQSEPKQKTPAGYEIPVPKRREFFGNLKKAAKKSAPRRRPKK